MNITSVINFQKASLRSDKKNEKMECNDLELNDFSANFSYLLRIRWADVTNKYNVTLGNHRL